VRLKAHDGIGPYIRRSRKDDVADTTRASCWSLAVGPPPVATYIPVHDLAVRIRRDLSNQMENGSARWLDAEMTLMGGKAVHLPQDVVSGCRRRAAGCAAYSQQQHRQTGRNRG
jgi:hypothetical protein